MWRYAGMAVVAAINSIALQLPLQRAACADAAKGVFAGFDLPAAVRQVLLVPIHCISFGEQGDLHLASVQMLRGNVIALAESSALYDRHQPPSVHLPGLPYTRLTQAENSLC